MRNPWIVRAKSTGFSRAVRTEIDALQLARNHISEHPGAAVEIESRRTGRCRTYLSEPECNPFRPAPRCTAEAIDQGVQNGVLSRDQIRRIRNAVIEFWTRELIAGRRASTPLGTLRTVEREEVVQIREVRFGPSKGNLIFIHLNRLKKRIRFRCKKNLFLEPPAVRTRSARPVPVPEPKVAAESNRRDLVGAYALRYCF